MEKYGVITELSKGDFDHTKKAEYFDEESPYIADKDNKDKLKKPKKITKENGFFLFFLVSWSIIYLLLS